MHADVHIVGNRVGLARELAPEDLHHPDALEAHVRQLASVLQADGPVEAQQIARRHQGRGHGFGLWLLFFVFLLVQDDAAVILRRPGLLLLLFLLLVLPVLLLLLLLVLLLLLLLQLRLLLLLRRALLVRHLLDRAHGVLELVPVEAAGDGRRVGDELAVVFELQLGVLLHPEHGLRHPDPLEAETVVVGTYAVVEQVMVEEEPRVVGLVGVQVHRLAVRAGRGPDLVLVSIVLVEGELCF
ncbi:uncharacterized protein PG986_000437 [Apiospora aurea]|uniref:Uncharacterized protein n=1 Tax=Apiospora aurea TaxID=335848 RepID=A0ABR1QU19_9PEZI